MQKIVPLVLLACCLSALPALADDLSPFQLTYQAGDVVSYPETTIASTNITLLNCSGNEVSDVVVSIPAQEPVSNYTIVLGAIPDGYTSQFVKTLPVTNDPASYPAEASVMWHVEYTNSSGERTSVDLSGEPAI
jgi:hypothetical protein